MAKTVFRRPFHELELPYQYRLQPPAFSHLSCGKTATPPATFGLRQIPEGALGGFERTNFPSNSSLSFGVNPLRVRAAYSKPLPS